MKYFLIIFSFVSYFGNCQLSVSQLRISENSKEWFDSEIGLERNEITVGVGEEIKILSRKNSAYFNGGRWSTGTVFYRGGIFSNTNLLFDVANNKLISKNDLTLYPYQLNKKQVDWFVIDGVRFERHDDPKIEGEKNNFVEVVHQGNQSSMYLYVDRQMRIKNGVNEYYDKRLILLKLHEEATYHKIRSKRVLKKLFPEAKKQLRSFFREERILFIKNSSKHTLKKLTKLCNQL